MYIAVWKDIPVYKCAIPYSYSGCKAHVLITCRILVIKQVLKSEGCLFYNDKVNMNNNTIGA